MDTLQNSKLDYENGVLTNNDAQKLVSLLTRNQLSSVLQNALVHQPNTILPLIRTHADKYRANRKIFIRGLSFATTSETLHSHFSVYGQVDEAAVATDKFTGTSKGFGFVTFEHVDYVLLAVKEPRQVIDGVTVIVAVSTNDNKAKYVRRGVEGNGDGLVHWRLPPPRVGFGFGGMPFWPMGFYGGNRVTGNGALMPVIYGGPGVVMRPPALVMGVAGPLFPAVGSRALGSNMGVPVGFSAVNGVSEEGARVGHFVGGLGSNSGSGGSHSEGGIGGAGSGLCAGAGASDAGGEFGGSGRVSGVTGASVRQ